MTKYLALVLFSLCFALPSVQADILVEWDGLNGAFQEPAFEGPGLEGINLTRGAGIDQAAGGTFNSNNFTVGANLLEAINNQEYLSFGLTVDQDNTVDISSIVVDLDRSATGPEFVNLFSDLTGFGALDSLATDTVSTSGSIHTFDLSGNAAFQGLTGSVEFRLYFNGATSAAGTADIENDSMSGESPDVGLQINGTSAIPEPASAGILAMLGLGILFYRRRI